MPAPGVTNSPGVSGHSGGSTVGAVEFVGKANFKEKVLQGSGPIVVEFMSFACGDCRTVNPIVHDIAKGLGNRVKVYQVNVPLDPDLKQKYGVYATPTFIMFKDGQEVGREIDPDHNAAAIRKAITAPFGIR